MKFVPTTAQALHTEPSAILSPADLESLTGTTNADEQIAWLRRQRISFLIGADQLPKVIWRAVS